MFTAHNSILSTQSLHQKKQGSSTLMACDARRLVKQLLQDLCHLSYRAELAAVVVIPIAAIVHRHSDPIGYPTIGILMKEGIIQLTCSLDGYFGSCDQ